jgi:hypothetical protein
MEGGQADNAFVVMTTPILRSMDFLEDLPGNNGSVVPGLTLSEGKEIWKRYDETQHLWQMKVTDLEIHLYSSTILTVFCPAFDR